MANPPTSQYAAGWSNPLSRHDWLRGDFYADLGRLLERGRFDLLFLPDALAVPEDGAGDVATTLRTGGKGSIYLDPVVTIAHASAATRHLGLGVTMSTEFVAPHAIARSIGTLDQLSGGRAAWNVVTSTTDAEARNFGQRSIRPREQRYDHADAVVQTVLDLWDTWEPGALRLDAEAGVFADPSRVHRIPDRDGAALGRGPLAFPHSPQGRPVLMQAGASPRGVEFAARWAELVFATPGTVEEMIRQRTHLRERAAAHGRDPDTLLYLPAVQPVLGRTTAAARARLAELAEALDDDAVLVALRRLLHVVEHVDPASSGADLVQAHRGSTGSDGFEQLMLRTARERSMSVLDLARQQAISQFNLQPVGSASEVADQLADVVDRGGADGIVLMPALYQSSFEEFVNGVVPELQRRGLVPERYRGTTLRENLLGR